MKFLHTADLHIGKKLFEQSLLEEQRHILDEIYRVALEEKVDAMVIAGDVYDRAVPSAEAVSLLDDFLTRLIGEKIPVLMISGNHDSPERVAFADRILEKQGLYIAGEYEQPPKTVVLEDEYGPVSFVLLPFVKNAVVGAENAADTVERILSATPMTMSLNQRYVLVTHFFVAGMSGEQPELSDSEDRGTVGGLDAVPSSLFQSFSYAALGHIHKPQHMGGRKVYYAGSPLKYSFSEWKTEKSVNLVELGEKQKVTVRRVPLKPLHDLRCLKGRLEDLMAPETVEENRAGAGCCDGLEDYFQITLTNTEELVDPMGTLRSVYPNVLQIIMEKNLRDADEVYESRLTGRRKGTAELFGEFYELLRGEPMDAMRAEIVRDVAEQVEERLK